MTTSPSTETNSAEADPNRSAAILILDEAGKITAANAATHNLWQEAPGGLNQRNFSSLFEFDVVSSEPDWIEMQWDALRQAGLRGQLRLQALRKASAPLAVVVTLEKIASPIPTFIATISTGSVELESRAIESPSTKSDEHDALRLLAEGSSIGFFDLNFREKRFSYSSAWKKMVGYNPTELKDTLETWTTLIHPEDSAATPTQSARKTPNSRKSFSMEFRLQHRNHSFRWVQCEGLQQFGPDGALDRVVGLNFDIQERKELEVTALAAEDRLNELNRCEGLALFSLDFGADEFWHSTGFDQLFGYEVGELEGTVADFQRLFAEEDSELTTREFWRSRAPGASLIANLKLQDKSGETIILSGSIVPQISRRGELLRVSGSLQHGSRPESPAPSSDAFLDSLNAIHESVIITDGTGNVSFLNSQARRFLGPDSDVKNIPATQLLKIVRRMDGREIEHPIEKILSSGEPFGLSEEYAISHPTAKTLRPIVCSGSPVKQANGGIGGSIFVFRNPEEMSLTPEEVIRANRFESLGVLAGGIAHDFNNLLSTILGGISVARETRDFNALEDSERACMAAKGLTKELLAFAKGGTGSRQIVSVSEVLRDSIRIAKAGSSATVEAFMADTATTISVHRSQIIQVFQNLIVNALQAMPPLPHRPEISLHECVQPLTEGQLPPLPAGDYVRIDVKDNGSGISPENLQKIFNPFFTTKKTGTGIGLATVLSIVRGHGGQIGVESVLGKGTTFSVFFPLSTKSVELEARRAPTLRFGNGRVLLMDDDEKICMFTARMLESLSYKYDVAKNGEEAIGFYKRYLNIGKPYDAVILDLTIVGGMGGEETYAALKKMDADVRAIVSSGYDNDEIAQEFLTKGFCGYLTKPYRVADLGKVLKGILG